MNEYRVNNVTFNYQLLGADRGYPAIVLIGGYACDINLWQPVADRLALYTQVLIFDNQGIGKTKDDGKTLSIESMAHNIKLLIDNLGLKTFIVAGFAMGGIIAQKLTYDYPEQVKKLILLNCVIQFSAIAKKHCESLCKLREQGDLKRYAILIYETVFGSKFKQGCSQDDFVSSSAESIKDVQTAKDQRRQVEVLKSCDATKWARGIHTDTLIIISEQDVFATPEEGHELAKLIRNAGAKVDVKLIESGHVTITEAFDNLMQIFLENLSGLLNIRIVSSAMC